ncbi:hypothetical protein ANRL3_01182 [Anaerolineae bacterium]|nr:hypothetical protein ANRL3_01182 [Anaerolineae bacterium]
MPIGQNRNFFKLDNPMSRVEEPRYNVIESNGRIEVREYGPMIVAETQVSGIRKEAIQQGFRCIAAYIFGSNTSTQKITMIAPVMQQQTRIPCDFAEPVDRQAWTVRFVMPETYTLDTLPAPDDPKVKLVPLGARRYIVIRFSGASNDENIRWHLAILQKHVAEQGIIILGHTMMAFYNPPWTLPFLRRNEIWLEIAPKPENP